MIDIAVEERGLDGLWLPDHTHIPVSGLGRTKKRPAGHAERADGILAARELGEDAPSLRLD